MPWSLSLYIYLFYLVRLITEATTEQFNAKAWRSPVFGWYDWHLHLSHFVDEIDHKHIGVCIPSTMYYFIDCDQRFHWGWAWTGDNIWQTSQSCSNWSRLYQTYKTVCHWGWQGMLYEDSKSLTGRQRQFSFKSCAWATPLDDLGFLYTWVQIKRRVPFCHQNSFTPYQNDSILEHSLCVLGQCIVTGHL